MYLFIPQQARAPDSPVVIIGTHCDMLKGDAEKERRKTELIHYLKVTLFKEFSLNCPEYKGVSNSEESLYELYYIDTLILYIYILISLFIYFFHLLLGKVPLWV